MQALTVKLSKKVVECSENQKCIQGLEPGQRTLLTKIFELEKQLSVLWHTLEKKEIEQNSIQEELAELKPVLVSAEVENKRLMEELEARQQEADKYQSRLEVVTQMQESMERAIEKVKQLKEAAVNISNHNSVSDLTCKAAVLNNQSYVEREYERRSDDGGVCSQSFYGDIAPLWLPRSPLFEDYHVEKWPPPLRDWSRQIQQKRHTTHDSPEATAPGASALCHALADDLSESGAPAFSCCDKLTVPACGLVCHERSIMARAKSYCITSFSSLLPKRRRRYGSGDHKRADQR